jgi:hypothetical protein
VGAVMDQKNLIQQLLNVRNWAFCEHWLFELMNEAAAEIQRLQAIIGNDKDDLK